MAAVQFLWYCGVDVTDKLSPHLTKFAFGGFSVLHWNPGRSTDEIRLSFLLNVVAAVGTVVWMH